MNQNLKGYINETGIRKAIQMLKPEGKLFEVRLLIKSPKKKTLSGYFKDVDTLLKAFDTVDMRGASSYISLNAVKDDCFSREQSEHFVAAPANTTSDSDIIGYDWLFIDLDPVRATGVSSSERELNDARVLGRRIWRFMKDLGFESPLAAESGNGYHLLYRIRLSATEENENLVKSCLMALDMLFSDEKVKVDTANFNPSRICKLYGTLAQKGTSTEDRPHRMSQIVTNNEPKPTDKMFLSKLADLLPKQPEKPAKYNNYNPVNFDIERWMQEHGLVWREKKEAGDYIKYLLEECPFDSSHKYPDACITVGNNGAIGFHCFHDHCQNKKWQDVRLLFEPDAYDKSKNLPQDSHIDKGWEEHRKALEGQQVPVVDDAEPMAELPEDKPMFLTAQMILDRPDEPMEFIKSGCEGIDYRMGGLQKGFLSVVSGLRGGSKSTWLSQVALQAVTDGHKVIFYSGELTSKNFMKWMWLQAAGRKHTKLYTGTDNRWFVEMETKKKIAEWLGDNFLLYENDYGNNFLKIASRVKSQIIATGADLVILDNLMAMDISDLDREKLDRQKDFVIILRDMARQTKAHIVFVAHPRKSMGLLRLQDVSGSSDLVNAVDNAFIVHRNNEDFKRLSKETFKWPDTHTAYCGTNVIEIAKDRDTGYMDEFIPLWYEKESKRLNNQLGEVIKYGWEPDYGEITPDEVPF